MLSLLFLDLLLPEFRAGVLKDLDIADVEIAQADHMHLPVDPVAAASDVAIERDLHIVGRQVVAVLEGLPAVGQDVGVVGPPGDQGRLAIADVSRELGYFNSGVDPPVPLVEVEQLALAPDFVLEPLLELFLGLLELLVLLEEVEVREYSQDGGESVALEEGEELEGLHFEGQAGVDDQQHQVGYLG